MEQDPEAMGREQEEAREEQAVEWEWAEAREGETVPAGGWVIFAFALNAKKRLPIKGEIPALNRNVQSAARPWCVKEWYE